jgi:hypothetical protein
MTRERELVHLFGIRGLDGEALHGLAGGVSATHLRTAVLTEAAFDAVRPVLLTRIPGSAGGGVQVLDHVPDARAR